MTGTNSDEISLKSKIIGSVLVINIPWTLKNKAKLTLSSRISTYLIHLALTDEFNLFAISLLQS